MTSLKIWHSISSIQEACRLSDDDIANIMQISLRKYKTMRSRKDLELSALFNISDFFNVSADRIANNSLNLKTIKEQYLGNKSFVKKRYRHHRFKDNTVPRAFINYIISKWGEGSAYLALQSCQVSYEAIMSQKSSVNLFFLRDLEKYMVRSLGANRNDFAHIGVDISTQHSRQSIVDTINDSKSSLSARISLVNEFGDKFSSYSSFQLVNVKNRCCEVIARDKEQARDEFKLKNLLTRGMLELNRASISYIVQKLNPSPIDNILIAKLKCIDSNRSVYTLHF